MFVLTKTYFGKLFTKTENTYEASLRRGGATRRDTGATPGATPGATRRDTGATHGATPGAWRGTGGTSEGHRRDI